MGSRRQLSALELVAISTSLPEFVADMAVLVLFDAAYTPGPLLAAVDPAQSVAALAQVPEREVVLSASAR